MTNNSARVTLIITATQDSQLTKSPVAGTHSAPLVSACQLLKSLVIDWERDDTDYLKIMATLSTLRMPFVTHLQSFILSRVRWHNKREYVRRPPWMALQALWVSGSAGVMPLMQHSERHDQCWGTVKASSQSAPTHTSASLARKPDAAEECCGCRWMRRCLLG